MDKVEQHKKICLGLNDLYAKKNNDYGDSFHQSYLEEGLAMARIRIGDKYSCFKTLSKKPDAQRVANESIRDTLLDLANYAIMTVLEMDAAAESALIWQMPTPSTADQCNIEHYILTDQTRMCSAYKPKNGDPPCCGEG